jgi:3-phenylpropionate/trans-cinnamate dioxygenase ferredoxin subunit
MCTTIDDWILLGKHEQVMLDAPLTLECGENGVGVYKVDDQLYAIEDICPHGPSLLSRGFVSNGKVKCPLHGAVFDIKTGVCLEGPAERNLQTYPVLVKDDDVYIKVESQ